MDDVHSEDRQPSLIEILRDSNDQEIHDHIVALARENGCTCEPYVIIVNLEPMGKSISVTHENACMGLLANRGRQGMN